MAAADSVPYCPPSLSRPMSAPFGIWSSCGARIDQLGKGHRMTGCLTLDSCSTPA